MKKYSILAIILVSVSVWFNIKASALRSTVPVFKPVDTLAKQKTFASRRGFVGQTENKPKGGPVVIRTRVSFSVSTNLPARPSDDGQIGR